MSTSIDVTATRWSGGWELAIDDDPITQVRHLEDAPQQVRDYLDTEDPSTDHSDVVVEVHVDLGEDLDEDLGERIESSRAAAREAHERQVEAAKQVRTVVRTLRANSVSVADVATILGVSRGRVSQLAKESAAIEASEGDAAAAIRPTVRITVRVPTGGPRAKVEGLLDGIRLHKSGAGRTVYRNGGGTVTAKSTGQTMKKSDYGRAAGTR